MALMVCLWMAPILASAAERPLRENQTQLPLGEAVELGLVEGLTEYLPVSSTGHLLLLQEWRRGPKSAQETEAANALTICIQSGAILAVVLLYYRRLWQMARGLLGGDRDGLLLFFNLIVAFLPAGVIGLLFGKILKETLFNVYSVIAALVFGALLILVTPWKPRSDTGSPEKELAQLSVSEALIVGCFQCLAFWPGFSRSLATILGCHFVKLRMSAAVEFSFLLGLVTLGAATAKEGISHGSRIIEQYGAGPSALALFTAFVSAVISVKFMVTILNRYGLAPFAYYRLILAASCLILLLKN